MSSSSTFIVGIGPSGTSQLTIPLSTPSTTSPTLSGSLITLTLTTMSSITLSGTSTSSTSPPAETAPASAASQTPNIGAMVGGSVGGALALLWILGLIYYAHRHSCFRRPGYTRHKEEKSGGFGFGKRDSSAAAAPVTEPIAPQPVSGFGARTFGVNARTFDEIRPSVYGGEVSTPGRASYADPPRTGYAEPPRTTFGQLPPAPTLPTKSNHTPRTSVFGGERPRSSFGERPRSGFGDRPRSGFGDRRSPSRRGFFNSGRDTEWEGAGRRINVEPGAEEEGRGGVFGWFARMKDHAANRRRVQAEYEEDMKRMRGRTAVESDYTRY